MILGVEALVAVVDDPKHIGLYESHVRAPTVLLTAP